MVAISTYFYLKFTLPTISIAFSPSDKSAFERLYGASEFYDCSYFIFSLKTAAQVEEFFGSNPRLALRNLGYFAVILSRVWRIKPESGCM